MRHARAAKRRPDARHADRAARGVAYPVRLYVRPPNDLRAARSGRGSRAGPDSLAADRPLALWGLPTAAGARLAARRGRSGADRTRHPGDGDPRHATTRRQGSLTVRGRGQAGSFSLEERSLGENSGLLFRRSTPLSRFVRDHDARTWPAGAGVGSGVAGFVVGWT